MFGTLNQKNKIAWLLIAFVIAFAQCEYNDSVLLRPPKTKLLAEADYYIWSTDSNRYLLNEKTQFVYSNGAIKSKYSYCRDVLPGHSEPTFIQCTSELFEYDLMNRTSSVDEIVGLTSLQENRFRYNDSNQLSQVTRYLFDLSKQKFIVYDSAVISVNDQSKVITTISFSSGTYATKATYLYDINKNATSIMYNESSSGNFLGQNTYFFDNRPNPLHATDFLSANYFDPNYFDNQNNVVKVCIKTPQQPGGWCIDTAYEYDSDGYPVSAVTSSGVPGGSKTIYKYY